MAVRVAVTACGLVFAVAMTRGTTTLAAVGVSIACADLISAPYLGYLLRKALRAQSRPILPSLLRTLAASGAMVLVMMLARGWSDLDRAMLSEIPILVATVLVGVAGYLVVQAALRAPELESVRARVAGTGARI
jgi:hypothetical protein